MKWFPLVLLTLIGLSLGLSAADEPAMAPADPAAFFIAPDTESELVWKLREPGPPGPREYRVTDTTGQTVTEGGAAAVDGQVRLKVRLPRGYYEVELEGLRFGLVVQDAFTGKPDPFFGIDAVLTWLDRRAEMRQAMVSSMKRSGIALARERINWTALEPTPGQWKWRGNTDETQVLRDIYAKAGMPVLEMFHSSGPAKGRPFPFKSSYPQDLVRLTESWPVIAEHLRPTWAGLEVWNEPEGTTYGSRLPADQYATLVRAMRYAWQSKGLTSPLGGGVLMGGDPGVFHRYCALNGVLDDSDFISIHDYKPATKTERLISVYQAWLEANGKLGMPLWMTEAGWFWPKGGARPPRGADAESALEITMKGIEAKACGVERYMPFCLAFYEEGGAKSFSMMGKEVTPLRSMAAYVQSIRALAGKQYLGDLPGADPALLRARVFAAEGESAQVAVLFTGKAETPVTVGFTGKILRAEALDGRELRPEADGRLRIPDGLAYVWFEGGDAPITDTRAMALLKFSRQPFQPRYQASSIVLQYIPDATKIATSSTRYMAGQDSAAALPIRVRVHNLAPQAAKLTLNLDLPGESATDKSRSKEIEVPARDIAEIDWVIDTRGRWEKPEPLPITVSALDAQGEITSTLAIPMQVEGELDSFLPHYSRKITLPLGETKRWSPNMTASGMMNVEALGVTGVKLDFTFKGGDRWAYPRFRLEPRALVGADGFVVRARVTDSADVRMTLTGAGGATYITFDPVIPADGKWHVFFVPLSQFEPNQDAANHAAGDWRPEEITGVSAGMNDRSKDSINSLEISDMYIVTK